MPRHARQPGPSTGRSPGGGPESRRLSSRLVALSATAVLTVYAAGYLRTQTAADQFAAEAAGRRPVVPAPSTAPDGPDPVDDGPLHARLTAGTLSNVAAGSIESADVEPPAERPVEGVVADKAAVVAPAALAATEPVVAQASATVPAAPTEASKPAAAAESASIPPVVSPTPAAPEPPAPESAVVPQYKDGTYTGWGTSRHGDIQAQVVIENGRITSATIARCQMRWPCSWIEALPPQVVERQSPETDYVSGATQSTNAFYYGVVQALGKASLP